MNEVRDECAWCGDYRHQHGENGCRLCGRFPWEKGIYACVGFVEKDDTDIRSEAIGRELEAQHE